MPRHIEYHVILRPSTVFLADCGKLMLDTSGMATFLGVPKVKVQQLIYTDRIPLPVRLGLGKTVRWNVLELLDWVQAGCPRRSKWIKLYGRSGWYRQNGLPSLYL